MTGGPTWRRLLVPVLVILPVLAVLVALGTWQVQRMGWKTQLLAEIAAAEASPAMPIPANPQPWTKVAVTGRLDHGREALLGLEVRGPVLGTHLLVPLLREDAPPILVDRGWVPLESRLPIARPEGLVTLEGYVRPGESAGLFAATDDTAGRRFYSFVPEAIGAALGLERVAPYGLVVLGAANGPPGALPDPARSLPRPTNSHLGYVITWYGLALSLLGVFAVWARRRLKDPA
ncbi:SURF1 family protein [Falsiroseomonas sp.]|uniref:SURF1 family protein n=1 Tax=Falsiroseomonas sp. TaxID=2870721 RepID=UPI0027354442|nr:SURF1 family cytochrome oxidase biogenesis protein [Falsiroseomonas sp.]MDP3414602.1 SURF1 family cytochrome oxidase biogenesis protein [Falsiroseomonas sp.]